MDVVVATVLVKEVMIMSVVSAILCCAVVSGSFHQRHPPQGREQGMLVCLSVCLYVHACVHMYSVLQLV